MQCERPVQEAGGRRAVNPGARQEHCQFKASLGHSARLWWVGSEKFPEGELKARSPRRQCPGPGLLRSGRSRGPDLTVDQST